MQPLRIPALVIVSGPPGAGKTTRGRRLAADLRLPFLAKDDIKELLFDAPGTADRAWSQRLGRAVFPVLFHAAATHLRVGHDLVLESNFHGEEATRDLRALQTHAPFRPVQVLLTCERDEIMRRFRARAASGARHLDHLPEVQAEVSRQVEPGV